MSRGLMILPGQAAYRVALEPPFDSGAVAE